MASKSPNFRKFGILALALLWPAQPVVASSTAIPLCAVHWARTCVVDGDTLWLGGTKIRLEDIDAPEVHPGRGGYRCAAEKRLGDRATLRLQQLLSSAPFAAVQVGRRPVDVYGRALRTIKIGGRSVGQQLVAEGLAHQWIGHKLPWCPAG
jgi:endonuclease YncB( thermonuclease family)